MSRRTLHELWSGLTVARPEAGSPHSPAGGDPANPPPWVCETCGGLGWISAPDPVLGDHIDVDCPTCWEPT